jgi:hypothetical protein
LGAASATAKTLNDLAVFGDPQEGHSTASRDDMERTSFSNFSLHASQTYS